jgi:ornithine cyclodeaminase/alanine dehydrogenase-like protein (mu-crystallin family)
LRPEAALLHAAADAASYPLHCLLKGRESQGQVTLFKSVGIALQDLLAADKVLARGERLNLGTELEI